MEIVPGIHRQESYLGKKLVAHHLIIGERTLLVDAGTPDVARGDIVPWLTTLLGDPARLDMLLVTHADVDHYGGLEEIRTACPRTLILAPAADRRWIEHPDAIFAERYDAYHADHGLTYEAAVVASLHAWHGAPVPVTIGFSGGEDLRCSADLVLRVLHVPGHTPGHLMLWEPSARVAIIGDALNGATQIDRDGTWTAPPPYTDRLLYLTTIQTVRSLAPTVLLTGHYPVLRGHEIAAFLDASRDFVLRMDAVLDQIFATAESPVTLADLIARVNPMLGPFAFPPDLQFAIAAHMDWLEQTQQVRRLQRAGVAAWARSPHDARG